MEPVSRFVVISILHNGIQYILGYLLRIQLGGKLWYENFVSGHST